MIYLKKFEELTTNDYRTDDPITKLQVLELIYNTIMDTDGDTFSVSKVEDQILDMEAAGINFKYKGVPFKVSIERVEGLKEGVGVGSVAPGSPDAPALPRKKSLKKIKKFKTGKPIGGKNALSGKIATHESIDNDFFEISVYAGSDDYKIFKEIIDQGIDSHLEGFTKSKFDYKPEEHRYYLNFHKSELDILLRRLQEMWEASEDDTIYQWIEDIKNYME